MISIFLDLDANHQMHSLPPNSFSPELIVICTSLFSNMSSEYSVKVKHSFMMPFPINIRLFVSR